jgi:hypothetical protein
MRRFQERSGYSSRRSREAPMSATESAATPVVPPANPPPSARRCENCGAPLLGEHCYQCGQTTKGLIRQFGSILGDFFDTVFNIDSRVFRTLGPLLLRPGYLSCEYFAGHRVRFVSPVRLFVFLSILAFLCAQWSLNFTGNGGAIRFGTGADTTLGLAATPEQVNAERKRALDGIDAAMRKNANVPGLVAGLEAAKKEVNKEADQRLAQLAKQAAGTRDVAAGPPPGTPAAKAPPGVAGAIVPAPPAAGEGDQFETALADDDGNFNFNDRPWDAKTNPVTVSWLPAAANAQLNTWIGRAKGNLKRIKQDPNVLKDAFLGVLPQTLFVLLPLFAALLKVLYLFKRRLYMEHLVVALHSHAFLCAVLLLQSLLALASHGVAPDGKGLIAGAIGWAEVALWIWMPVYLLLMQKKVYGQGWIMTALKFGVVGFLYMLLLTFGAAGALLVSLVKA